MFRSPMLQIGAHQERQWGVMMLALPGRSLLDRSVDVGSGACKGKRLNVNWGFRSRISTDITLSSSRRKRVVVMENASVEPRAMDVDILLGGEPRVERSSSFNSKINKASKWVVVLLVTVGILWRHDEHALWFAIGSVVNGGFGKCLKYLINESRPPTAEGVKEDPGMPSSHAQGFSYIATYATLAWLLWQGITVWTSISSLGILLSLAYLSWLRVVEGLHTVPQVLVGSILGIAAAAVWLWVWKGGVEAAVYSSLSAKCVLYISSVAACVVCYFISLKDQQFWQP